MEAADWLPLPGIVIYLMFGAWFGITLAVLLGMDVLERLGWGMWWGKFPGEIWTSERKELVLRFKCPLKFNQSIEMYKKDMMMIIRKWAE